MKVALFELFWKLLKIQSGIHDNEKDTGDIDQAESSLCAVGLHELLCGDFFKHEFPVPSNPAAGRRGGTNQSSARLELGSVLNKTKAR